MELTELMLDYRAKNGLSVEKAAKAAGISMQTWRSIETGQQDPTRLTKRKLELFLTNDEANPAE